MKTAEDKLNKLASLLGVQATAEETISGYYRLIVDGEQVLDDSANEDANGSYEEACAYFFDFLANYGGNETINDTPVAYAVYEERLKECEQNDTYRIVCTTDPYHASQYVQFDSEGRRVDVEGLTLSEAYKKLLHSFNNLNNLSLTNWGQAIKYQGNGDVWANQTFKDKTRSFVYGVYTYHIEKEDNDEE